MEQSGKAVAGVIGLGIIGNRVAANLRRAGYQVWLWNRTLRPEPNFLSSPAEVAESAKHIQIFVANGEALLSVVKAMAPVLTPEHIVMNHATVSPKETLEAAAIVREKHAVFLDAPFTGSRDAAAQGELIYYVAGDPSALTRVRSLLEASSKKILTFGEIGQATVIKIATNVISATAVGALAEALALLHSHGVELNKLSEALESNAARSPVIDMKLPGMIHADFDPRFSLKNMFKDVQIALSAAEDKNLELPTASAFAGTAMAGLQRGWGESDFSVISRFYEYPGQATTPANPLPPATPTEPLLENKSSGMKNLWGIFRRKK